MASPQPPRTGQCHEGNHGVIIENVDPDAIDEDEISALVAVPILTYEPSKTANRIFIQLADIDDAIATATRLNGKCLLGREIHAYVASQPSIQTHGHPPGAPVHEPHLYPHPQHQMELSSQALHSNRVQHHMAHQSMPHPTSHPGLSHQMGLPGPHLPLQMGISGQPPKPIQEDQMRHPQMPCPTSLPGQSSQMGPPGPQHRMNYQASMPFIPPCVASTGQQQTACASFTVKVTHLSPDVTTDMLCNHFSQAGELAGAPTIHESRSRYAHVNYRSFSGAQNAEAKLHHSTLGGWRINVKYKGSLHTGSPPGNGPAPLHLPQSPPHPPLPDVERGTVEVIAVPQDVQEEQVIHPGDGASPITVEKPPHYSGDKDCVNVSTDAIETTCSEKTLISSEPTQVVFRVNCSTSQADFKKYLDDHLPQDVCFEIVQCKSLESGSEVEVKFTSLYEAKSALTLLNDCDPNLEGTIGRPSSDLGDLRNTIAKFKESIESKIGQCMSEHKRTLDGLKLKQQQLVLPKKCSLSQHQQITAERESLKQAIEERERHQQEFVCYCEQLQRRLNQLDLSGAVQLKIQVAIVSQMRKSFGCEYNRFKKALPIYAYRSEIVEVVQANQVSILIGETGSGKSTQLVQYLYGAGFSEQGIIVCTQPRKVAAISLAKHVSTEMGEAVGRAIGYKAGTTERCCAETKVMYMTDHTLLNECISDPTFAKYSCLVIDEAHERSLNTDILLAFIKQSLPSRPDLRVIITSATIDPDLFVDYFGGDCPVVKVPGRTFPVDVIWNPLNLTESPIERKYVQDAVNLVCDLHRSEPPGDILVFLTSPFEIEQACQQATEKFADEALVLPLHGKLQPEDQDKVFSQDHTQRKIVFATNVAETSVTIPGVKYIVDTGLAKELRFDPKKNMNSLEVRVISKSSAEQRKGRAGRTSAGKCYRLYSEELYKTMPDKMLPEILHVSLAGTALKLYEFGISDILSFNFVEQPDKTALKTAMESLAFLGATSHDRLTDLGKKMAALPIDPHLSKVLLDGIDEGVGPEAAVAVAISTLAGSVFFRAGTDEMKKESDAKTISFCHPAGDQMTYLQVYHQWASQDKFNQTKWCVDNSVNAKSMRMVRESVNEIHTILANKFQIEVSRESVNLEKAEEKLPKLFFNAFIRNLSVFLGHERVGYVNTRLPHDRLIIFPGSPLCKLNDVPQLLVYEKTLKTSQHFLLQVLPVKEEWVQEAIAAGRLPIHPTELDVFQHLKVSPLTIENLGQHVLTAIKRNRQEIDKELTSAGIQPVMEFLRKEGILRVYLPTRYHDPVLMLLQAHISSIKDELQKELYECGVTKESDDVRLLLRHGGAIEQILMPHEYRTVVVKGPKNMLWQDELYQRLAQYGLTQKPVSREFEKDHRLFVTFRNPDDALRAVTSVQPPENVLVEPQLFQKQGGEGLTLFSLKIEWCRRERKPFAIVKFQQEEDLAIASARIYSISIGGSPVRFRLSKDGKCQLFATNVRLHVTEEQIKQAVLLYIPEVNQEDIVVTLGFEKSFETTPEQHAAFEELLHSHVSRYTTKGKYKLNLLQPKSFHCVYIAYINFQNPDEGQRTLTGLRAVTVDGKSLTVKPSLSSVVRYSSEVYKVIQESVEVITTEIHTRYPSVKISHDKRDQRGNVVIRISSDDVNTFSIAKHALNSVISPEVIECRNQPLREFIHTTNCKKALEEIESETCTLLRIDYRTITIKMYGTQANLTQAKIKFNRCLSFIEQSTKCYEIHLKKPGMPPGLMKHLVSQFGHGLQGMEERDGIQTARLDPQKQILTIFATADAHKSVVEMLEAFARKVSPDFHTMRHNPDTIECCVCFTSLANPSDIVRLETCGHAYCCECIELQLAPTVVTVPVVCAADECAKPFVLKDFESLPHRIDFKLQNLAKVSLRTYIAANRKLVHVCPTPDCDMVYNVTEDGRCFFCSHCGVMTCTKCHEPYHDGLSCDMYQAGKKGDKEFEEWMKTDPGNRKRCPKCATPIEKMYGCNKLHCTSCGANICWVCLKYFDTSNACYGHLQTEHGSFV